MQESTTCGIYLWKDCPLYGASPDGICGDFIIEMVISSPLQIDSDIILDETESCYIFYRYDINYCIPI